MTKKESYHFIGIGGIGMSALAQILLEKEHSVSGSDLVLSETAKKLEKKGAKILTTHAYENVESTRSVVYSSAVQENNPEMQAAKEWNCPLLHRSELLAKLISTSQSLAIAGTHGKTTTSALLASILLKAKKEISFAIGGVLKEYGVNGRAGHDSLFVLEADESDRSFLRYFPYGAIVTNVDEEHMESYGTREELDQAFAQFFTQVSNENLLFYCGDDPHLPRLAAGRGRSYGFSKGCDVRIRAYRQEEWHILMDLEIEGRLIQEIKVALTGQHNALNAAAVFALARQLGIPEEIIREGLLSFQGVQRRTEKKYETEQLLLIDDYAHHPTEIRATLKAIREAIGPRRMIVLFQPHRYSRTQNLLEEFGAAFDESDLLFITDIYAASEKPIAGITKERLLEKIHATGQKEAYPFSFEGGLPHIGSLLVSQDVVVTLGAGSITYFSDQLADYCAHFGVRKLKIGMVFGGQSVEHEISRKSAASVITGCDPLLYELFYFAIDKGGRWQMGGRAKEMLTSEKEISFADEDLFFTDKMKKVIDEIDLFFPVIHGAYGEDGTLQGLFEMLQKPYVGPSHRSGAVGMDKAMTKRLLLEAGVPTPPYLYSDRSSWKKNKDSFLEEVAKKLSYPLYVKPVHLGSSIGITKVEKESELFVAIDYAFHFDREIIVEQGIVGGRELEFAVMGEGSQCEVPPPGEKLAGGQFVNYQMKYSNQPVQTAVVATLSPQLVKQGCELAKKAYCAIGGSGLTRVDFLLDQQNQYWCFEVNPIPGMMRYSLFPKMWEAAGRPLKKLVNRLIALGLSRGRQRVS